MIPKKHAPGLIRGGNRFSEKIMLNQRTLIADPFQRRGRLDARLDFLSDFLSVAWARAA